MPGVNAEDGGLVVPVWINGKAEPLEPSRFIEVRSSVQNNKVIHRAQGADTATATAAVDSAWDAFQSWRKTSYSDRRDILLRAADIYERRADEIIKRQVDETSCADSWGRFNVDLSIRNIRETAASIATALSGDIPPIASEGMGFIFKEPIGPVLQINPWNAALFLATRGITAALAAGCSVVLKASEICPLTHHFIVEAYEEAGLPAGCLNVLSAARKDGATVTETLISHPNLRKVEFVGSAGVGRLIGQTCAKYLKPILMELGGKGPAIVLADANLANAANLCAAGAFMHHGQICMSTERIIVEKSIAKEFTEHLKQVVSKTYSQPIFNAATTDGAVRAQKMLDDAKKNGANFIAGDNSFMNESKSSVTPTIITDVNPSEQMWDEETFGPSATLHVVDDVEAAIKLANASAYGLNATIHTRNIFKGLQYARRLDYGQVHLNNLTTYDEDTLSMTGSKASGWGSNGARYGISQFLINKTVTVQNPDQLSFGFGDL